MKSWLDVLTSCFPPKSHLFWVAQGILTLQHFWAVMGVLSAFPKTENALRLKTNKHTKKKQAQNTVLQTENALRQESRKVHVWIP